MTRKRKPEQLNPINTPHGIADDSDQFDDPHGLESAYRRGFAHGAHFAIEANRRGWTLDDLADWFSRIYRWRRTVHKGHMEGPELPNILTA